MSADLTSEGIHVSSVVRCDGIQVNTATALPLPVVSAFTWAANRKFRIVCSFIFFILLVGAANIFLFCFSQKQMVIRDKHIYCNIPELLEMEESGANDSYLFQCHHHGLTTVYLINQWHWCFTYRTWSISWSSHVLPWGICRAPHQSLGQTWRNGVHGSSNSAQWSGKQMCSLAWTRTPSHLQPWFWRCSGRCRPLEQKWHTLLRYVLKIFYRWH